MAHYRFTLSSIKCPGRYPTILSLISCWCPSKLPKELSWILSGLKLQSMASLSLSRKPYHLLHQRNENCWGRHHHRPSSLSSDCSNNIPQTREPKPQTFISPSSRGLKSEIKALTDLGSGDSPHPSLQVTFFLLWPHSGKRAGLGLPLLWGVPLAWPHLNLITSQRSHHQIPSCWG